MSLLWTSLSIGPRGSSKTVEWTRHFLPPCPSSHHNNSSIPAGLNSCSHVRRVYLYRCCTLGHISQRNQSFPSYLVQGLRSINLPSIKNNRIEVAGPKSGKGCTRISRSTGECLHSSFEFACWSRLLRSRLYFIH